MRSNKDNTEIRVRFVGNSGVGISKLIARAADGHYDDIDHHNNDVFGSIEKKTKAIKNNNKTINLGLEDRKHYTAKDRQSQNYQFYAYRGDIFFLTYDVTNEKSFLDIEKYYKDILDNRSEKPVIVLIGTKNDSSNKIVSTQDAKALADKLGIPFFEVSAKTNHNIDAAFARGTEMVLQKQYKDKENIQIPDNSFDLLVDATNKRLDQYYTEVENRWFDRGKNPTRQQSVEKLVNFTKELKSEESPSLLKFEKLVKKILEVKSEIQAHQKKGALGFLRITHSSLDRALDKALKDVETKVGKKYLNQIKADYKEEKKQSGRLKL